MKRINVFGIIGLLASMTACAAESEPPAAMSADMAVMDLWQVESPAQDGQAMLAATIDLGDQRLAVAIAQGTTELVPGVGADMDTHLVRALTTSAQGSVEASCELTITAVEPNLVIGLHACALDSGEPVQGFEDPRARVSARARDNGQPATIEYSDFIDYLGQGLASGVSSKSWEGDQCRSFCNVQKDICVAGCFWFGGNLPQCHALCLTQWNSCYHGCSQ